MADKFIQKAISRPGALTAKAKKTGQTPMAFAHKHRHAKGKTGQQARFAILLSHLRGGKK